MSLDQFYTTNNIALKCYKQLNILVDINKYDILLEPSAGTGSFFKLLPTNKRIGLDVAPKCDNILKKDYFDYVPQNNKNNLF